MIDGNVQYIAFMRQSMSEPWQLVQEFCMREIDVNSMANSLKGGYAKRGWAPTADWRIVHRASGIELMNGTSITFGFCSTKDTNNDALIRQFEAEQLQKAKRDRELRAVGLATSADPRDPGITEMIRRQALADAAAMLPGLDAKLNAAAPKVGRKV